MQNEQVTRVKQHAATQFHEVDLAEGAAASELPVEPPGTGDQAAFDKLYALIRRQMEIQERESLKQEQRWQSVQVQLNNFREELEGDRDGPYGDPHERSDAFGPSQRPESVSQDVIGPEVAISRAWGGGAVPKFEEGDDIEQYLTTFERLATAYKWPRADWAVHLVPHLTGRARAAFVAMDMFESMNYDKVREAILAKYEINEEMYRLRFREPDHRPGETPRELYNRLKDLYKKWIKPEKKTVEQVGEVLILEQYLATLSHEVRVWVKEHNPKTGQRAAELVEAFVAARQGPKVFRKDQSHRQPPVWGNKDHSLPPTDDGLVERYNQTLKSMLKKFVAEDGKDWDRWLPYLMFSYREVPQASTGYSPFELLYGRQVRGPLEVLRDAWDPASDPQPVPVLQYVMQMREKMEQLSQLVHEMQRELLAIVPSGLFVDQPGYTTVVEHNITLKDPCQCASGYWMTWLNALALPVHHNFGFMSGVLAGALGSRGTAVYSLQDTTRAISIHCHALWPPGAPATFQRLMDQVLEGAGAYAGAYLDDIVVFSHSWKDHLEHLQDIFQRLKQAGLTAQPKKCALARQEAKYLGYLLGHGVIRPQQDKVEAVRNCPRPQTKSQLRLDPEVHAQSVVMEEEHERAFQDLKEALCKDPVLQPRL
ncbi:hypothetical protein WMY93_018881 [Mugilogobius chulae]|uniref:ribonuclease H n=1 Tax=Mugilogobius chulae TaxID=88201 RepID=A0AAW0NQ21_9GOBI